MKIVSSHTSISNQRAFKVEEACNFRCAIPLIDTLTPLRKGSCGCSYVYAIVQMVKNWVFRFFQKCSMICFSRRNQPGFLQDAFTCKKVPSEDHNAQNYRVYMNGFATHNWIQLTKRGDFGEIRFFFPDKKVASECKKLLLQICEAEAIDAFHTTDLFTMKVLWRIGFEVKGQIHYAPRSLEGNDRFIKNLIRKAQEQKGQLDHQGLHALSRIEEKIQPGFADNLLGSFIDIAEEGQNLPARAILEIGDVLTLIDQLHIMPVNEVYLINEQGGQAFRFLPRSRSSTK